MATVLSSASDLCEYNPLAYTEMLEPMSWLTEVHTLCRTCSGRRVKGSTAVSEKLRSAALRGVLSVSRPGEFRPQPLAEPYVTVSRHTAPIALPQALP